MSMKPYSELSEHDKRILARIESLDELGYQNWPEISHLADQLEDEDRKRMWHNTCRHYNHLEEASIGEL